MSGPDQVFRVYWQPGCSSCLRTKEFLAERGIPFESINVAANPGAVSELASLGFRSVPVLARGSRGVACQDLAEVASFLDVAYDGQSLDAPALIDRLDALLRAAQRFAVQLTDAELDRHFVGRDRSFRDLAFHIFMIPEGFLDAARGGSLEMAHFLKRPPEDLQSGSDIAAFGEVVRRDLLAWFAEAGAELPDRVATYYGDRATLSVLERTAWHAAQHCRQLEAVLRMFGHEPNQPLEAAELDGLPLPANIYDDEMTLAATG